MLLLPTFCLLVTSTGAGQPPNEHRFPLRRRVESPNHLHELDTPYNISIRYKEPSICETTPGVKSYSGFVDTREGSHTFFWFFEARIKPETAPITIWLNGGPGSDSLIGLFKGTWSLNNGAEYSKLGFTLLTTSRDGPLLDKSGFDDCRQPILMVTSVQPFVFVPAVGGRLLVCVYAFCL